MAFAFKLDNQISRDYTVEGRNDAALNDGQGPAINGPFSAVRSWPNLFIYWVFNDPDNRYKNTAQIRFMQKTLALG